MNYIAEDILMHYGTKRHSGRYPWGSGDSPYQHEADFLARYNKLKAQGLTEVQIAEAMECVDGTKELRMYKRIADHERMASFTAKAQEMRDAGKTFQEISDELGLSGPAAARSLVLEKGNSKQKVVDEVYNKLKEEVAKKGAIDIGLGAEAELGVSADTLKEAATRLAMTEGYDIRGVGIPQVLGKAGHNTTIQVLSKDISYGDLYKNPELIKQLGDEYSPDGGFTWRALQYPASIDSKRVDIRYADDGGADMDGVIELRQGVKDLSLGNAHYAQVRILVDGTHYLKGMAMYADDLPDGVDVRFNTNKHSDTPKMDVLKKIKDDPENPFGATISARGQSDYIGDDGKTHLSAINKVNEESAWNDQRTRLSAQFLGKQSIKLAQQQLDLKRTNFEEELDRISKVTNNAVKQKMLADFADECDKAANDLSAAALPRQKNQVLLPLTKIKDTEIYAPNYNNGEQVALIRYPHAGTFEIPILTVNNKNPQGKKLLEGSLDAVGINAKVAQKLSGADFDGDSVTVIPLSNKIKIKSTPTLKGLERFDPKEKYPPVLDKDGNIISKTMSKHDKGIKMGQVSNLITDMTLKGADPDELARAVRHSMVVIDAEKHKLNYKQSAIDNDIASLTKKYQIHTDLNGDIKESGPSTLLSRANAKVRIDERRAQFKIDPDTGEKIYFDSGREYYTYKKNKDGTSKKEGPFPAKQEVTQMSLVKDAAELSSGTKMESVYVGYANQMKAMANKARKEMISTPNEPKYNKNAAATYEREVAHLNALLKDTVLNKPKERQAQIKAKVRKDALLEANPELKKKENKQKLNNRSMQILMEARAEVGAKSQKIKLTDREWDAIQAGAISFTKAKAIMNKMDPDELKERATPRQTRALTSTQQNRIKHLSSSGYTQAEIAEAMGISTSSVSKYLGEKIKDS